MHPIVSFAMSNLAYMPLRALVTLPVLVILIATHAKDLSHDWRIWLIWCFAMAGAWLITFFVNIAVGSLSFFIESSIKVMDVWLALFFVFSGYLFPLDLFPPWLRAMTEWLPFRYQIALPVELMTGKLQPGEALELLGRQYLWAGALVFIAISLWRNGIKRFQAFGG
jgi:ABC-2 type transport system permease protein